MKKLTKMIVVLLLLSFVLAACAQKPADNEPQKLTVLCGAQEDWCQLMTQTFQEKTGITTNYVRMSSGEAMARINASKDTPEFDVWHGGPADGYMVAKNDGLLEAYVSPNAEKIPAKFKDSEGYWTGVYVGALGFCSNKDVLDSLGAPVPQSWEDLLNPALKTQIAMAHPATSGTAFTAFWTQMTLKNFDEAAAFDYFRQLHNNILQYTKSGSAPGKMAGQGEVAVAIIFSHDCVKFNEEGMSSLVVSFPEEGTGYEVGGVAIVKNAQNLDAAKQYVDWTLTAEAQELGAQVKSYQLPTNPDAKVSEKTVKLAELNVIDYDFFKSADAKKGITEKFDADIAPAPKE